MAASSPPFNLHAHSTTVIPECPHKVLLFGGFNDRGLVDCIEVLDTQTWAVVKVIRCLNLCCIAPISLMQYHQRAHFFLH